MVVLEACGVTSSVDCQRCGSFQWPGPSVELADVLDPAIGLRLSAATRKATDAGQPLVFESVDHLHQIANQTALPSSFAGYVDAVMDALAITAGFPGRDADFKLADTLAARTFLDSGGLDGLARGSREGTPRRSARARRPPPARRARRLGDGSAPTRFAVSGSEYRMRSWSCHPMMR